MIGVAGLGSSDFYREMAKRYLPQPGGLQSASPGGLSSYMGQNAGGRMPFPGGYGSFFQQNAPSYMGFFKQNQSQPRMPRGGIDRSGSMEARASSGDAYSNLTSDPFAKGPGGFLNLGP
jgi:hypothetical protein